MILGQSTKLHGLRSQSDYYRMPHLAFLVLTPSDKISLCLRSLGLGVLQDYTKLKTDTQAKNIAAWTPVVAEILHGFCKFDDKAVCPVFSFSL